MSNPENTSSSSIAPSTGSARGVSPWWRTGAIACAIVLLIAVASALSLYAQFGAQMQHMQKQLQTVAQIKTISILTDGQQAPAMLITQDPQEFTLQLQRLNNVAEGQEDSMQLWALSGTERPRSLGLLSSKIRMQRLNASDQDLANVDQLAISVENKGGVPPSQGPRLPYLFKGAVVQKTR